MTGLRAVPIVALVVVLGFTSWSGADMGAIAPIAAVKLDEPAQRAIIAHDGFEEVLILGTDFKASEQTRALRFIPLPSEPTVSLAPQESFAAVGRLAADRGLRYLVQYRGDTGAEADEAVEVLLSETIGPHDITIVHVRDVEAFTVWVQEFFESKGLPVRELSSKEEAVVAAYLEDDFPYFVFDLIDVGPDAQSIQPLLLRFESDVLFYPLRTSNLIGGNGTIELFVFCDRGELHKHMRITAGALGNISPGKIWLESDSAVVTADEMRGVAPEIADLLGARAVLRAFRYDRQLKFDGDVAGSVPRWETRITGEGRAEFEWEQIRD